MSEAITLNREQVEKILPHRDPMLLIDEVMKLIPGKEIVASFHVKPDMAIFQGHFPGNPILPGVYTVEATAQAADLLLMTTERYAGKTPLFMGIKNAKFRKKIIPGDKLEIHAELLSEHRERGFATCLATVYIDGDVAAESEVSLAMR